MDENSKLAKLKKEQSMLHEIKLKLQKIDEALDKSIDNNPDDVLQKLNSLN